ncbi:MAG: glycine cleavage system protein H [Acidobacteriota bacterium]
MSSGPHEQVRYKRARFSTRLPAGRLYTSGHFWMSEQEPNLWQVGMTKFATRMLGEMVEHGFEVEPGKAVQVGQVIGWVEGFKAASDLFCVVDGQFQRGNPNLDEKIRLLHTDPYGKGWLYEVRGTPEPNAVDVHGYVEVLDETIDRIRGKED